jgi:pimeloyl-ACP methyl ester carboxylesterase
LVGRSCHDGVPCLVTFLGARRRLEKEAGMQAEELVAPSMGSSSSAHLRGVLPQLIPSEEHPLSCRSDDIDGHLIRYVDEGEGPLLLFVEADSGSFLWRDVIVRLRERFRCVALDVPCATTAIANPNGRLDFGTPWRILESFVRALDLRDLILVLHDLGGPVGLGIAPRLHPRIRALIVVESFGWPLPHGTPGLARMREDDLRGVDRTLRSVLRDRQLLLVFGKESPRVKAGFPERWRERFPDAGLLLVEGSRRFPMADAPDLVARAIKGWWREDVRAA